MGRKTYFGFNYLLIWFFLPLILVPFRVGARRKKFFFSFFSEFFFIVFVATEKCSRIFFVCSFADTRQIYELTLCSFMYFSSRWLLMHFSLLGLICVCVWVRARLPCRDERKPAQNEPWKSNVCGTRMEKFLRHARRGRAVTEGVPKPIVTMHKSHFAVGKWLNRTKWNIFMLCDKMDRAYIPTRTHTHKSVCMPSMWCERRHDFRPWAKMPTPQRDRRARNGASAQVKWLVSPEFAAFSGNVTMSRQI